MSFKKDYINYTLTSVLENELFTHREYFYVRKILERVIANEDIAKTMFIIGKTEGLDQLFKYLIYISDKIDKSHVSIFNFKDNFEYDISNLKKICDKISKLSVRPAADLQPVQIEQPAGSITEKETSEIAAAGEFVSPESIISTTESKIQVGVPNEVNEEIIEESPQEAEKETPELEKIEEDSSLTLIENKETESADKDVFELSEISEAIGIIEDISEDNAEKSQDTEEPENILEEANPPFTAEDLTEGVSLDEILIEKGEEVAEETAVLQDKAAGSQAEKDTSSEVPVEISNGFTNGSEQDREEPVANEVYYRFENKFFEDVKILEKLFKSVDRDIKSGKEAKLSDSSLHRYTEIIGISSELANLTRQLSFDLMSDIFMTINLFFTKAINKPLLVTPLRIKLFASSLELANSLIKGENYLNYDMVVKEIEQLKLDIEEQPPVISVSKILPDKEEPSKCKEEPAVKEESETDSALTSEDEDKIHEQEFVRGLTERRKERVSVDETIVFKLKYLVKQLESSYLSIGQIQGEYRKYDALEKIDEMNSTLKMIAKLSSSAKLFDALKLSEVSYIFLKYLKDYRLDLQDTEIQQILKYIIFTFKMLLTRGKPEDFNVLVQYLNDPVKIFTNA